jgi:MFS family permease
VRSGVAGRAFGWFHVRVANRAEGARPATYRALFGSREYAALWAGQAVSLAGDQVARVAIVALVYDATGSALASGATYALTMLPWLIGGPLLSQLADRYPRRGLMLACQVLAGLLVGVMALPGMPLLLLTALLFLVALIGTLERAARAALLVDVLPDDRYVLASATNQLTSQMAQVTGFAFGGWMVATIGARGSLLVDAASFLVAALLVGLLVHERPLPDSQDDQKVGWWQRLRAGAGVVLGDTQLRGLMLLAWTAAFWVVPEGLAAPYVEGNETQLGLLLASMPAGTATGALLIGRLVAPARRLRWMWPLAMLCGVPLLAFVVTPPLPVAMALLVVAGFGAAYNLPANAAFMQAVPPARRAQAFGLVSTGLVAGQGLSVAAAGAIAEFVPPALVIAAAGALGILVTFALRGAVTSAARSAIAAIAEREEVT